MRISKYDQQRHTRLPVFGDGVDIKAGASLKRGATAGTDTGTLIKASGTAAQPDIIAILSELHDFSVSNDTLQNGTKFITHDCELVVPTRIINIEYDLASVIDATQAVTTTTITLTSLEDDIDQGFLYVVAGTGIGQTNFLTASAAGSATLKAAFGTSLDTTSDIIKILPRFHTVAGLNSDGTKLSSQAGAGSVTVLIIDSYIDYNGQIEQLDPTKNAALKSLNSARGLKFGAHMVFRNTGVYTID